MPSYMACVLLLKLILPRMWGTAGIGDGVMGIESFFFLKITILFGLVIHYFLHSLGELAVCVNKQPWRSYCIQPPCGQIEPTNAFVFGIFRDIYRHLNMLIGAEESIHMGGDEVNKIFIF